MFVNLQTYIKNDFIKQRFMKSCIVVSTIEEAENLGYSITDEKPRNIIFENSSLKNRFFAVAKNTGMNINIINCDSLPSRILEDLNNSDGFLILHNINKCSDLNILNQINNSRILIC